MKIHLYPSSDSKTATLEEFADEHGLDLRMQERRPENRQYGRWFCYLEGLELAANGMLASASGNGETQAEVISSYCEEISGKRAKLRAYTGSSKYVDVPTLTP